MSFVTDDQIPHNQKVLISAFTTFERKKSFKKNTEVQIKLSLFSFQIGLYYVI